MKKLILFLFIFLFLFTSCSKNNGDITQLDTMEDEAKVVNNDEKEDKEEAKILENDEELYSYLDFTTLNIINNEQFSLSKIRGDKPIIMQFWASW